MGHDRAATIGLNLRSLGFGISFYSDLYVSTAILISLDM